MQHGRFKKAHHLATDSKGMIMKRAAKKAKKVKPMVFSFALLFFNFLVSGQAATLPRTAKVVPPETVVLVEVDDFSQLRQQFEKTSLYRFYTDPAMAAFVDDFKTKLRAKIKEIDNKIAEAIFSADVMPQGRVAVAVVFGEQTRNSDKPAVLLMTQWGDTTGTIKEAVEEAVKKAVEGGRHRKIEDYREVTIVTITKELPSRKVPDFSNWTPDSNSAPAMKTIQPPPTKTHYCFVDDCLIVSTNVDVLKFVIAHLKGASSATLADDIDYINSLKAVGPYHDVDLYINIKQVVKTMVSQDSSGKAKTTAANLGFDNVRCACGSAGIGRIPGSSFNGKAIVTINGAKMGLCRILDMETAPVRAPRFVPKSACSVIILNVNIKKAYDELYSILYNFSPQQAAVMHLPLLPPSPDGQPGLELKSGIIDNLGSQIVVAQSINKPFSASQMPTESLIALAASNPQALEKSVSLLHSKLIAPNNPDARRELLGHTVYLVSIPGLPFFVPGYRPMQVPGSVSARQRPTFAFTVTDTHLILGVESSVERAIRTLSSGSSASVGSSDWFTAAESAMPSVTGLSYVENNKASAEMLWWLMKESGKGKASTAPVTIGMGMTLSQMGEDLFDFNLLPKFEAVRKYFGASTFYGISRPGGFFFEFKDVELSGSK